MIFPLIYLIEGATRPGFDAWRQTISALSLGPDGWIQRANFIMLGVVVIWLAFVWSRILGGGSGATWYPIMRGVEGVGLIAIGIVTRDPLHTVLMVGIVTAMCVSLVVIARRLWSESNLRRWAVFTLVCGLWPNVLMPFFGVALSSHGLLGGYAGLLERLATNADTVWGAVLLIPLWAGSRLMRAGAPAGAAPRH
ncbi:MAG TPA: DUF998 domain-containing protein [Thermomicrobiaceae bacterium]|nr:DUF998 domain-containing protein [Thermomicrobiaceae bacterium]